MTIDPVSTANPGWNDFLIAYNRFCIDRGGKPLFNQTPLLTKAIVQQAFGDRLKELEQTRKQFDPDNRLLNPYFRELLV
jgi:FAD/FMN-containing dehydrogenase